MQYPGNARFGAVPGLAAARAGCDHRSAESVKKTVGLKVDNREKQQLMSRVKNEFHLAYECSRSFRKVQRLDTEGIARTTGAKSCRQYWIGFGGKEKESIFNRPVSAATTTNSDRPGLPLYRSGSGWWSDRTRCSWPARPGPTLEEKRNFPGTGSCP